MNKFYLKTLLLCLFSFIGMAQAFAHDIEVANEDGVTIYYSYINNKTELAVTHRGSYYNSYSNEYSGEVAIPESVTYTGKTYSVTSIGDYAFYSCSGLTSVTIPNSVTSIGEKAFYNCSGLTSVTIPNSVTSIDSGAFGDCINLTDLTFSDGIDTLNVYSSWYHPFSNCPIERLYLGRNLYYYEERESWGNYYYSETPLFFGYESLNSLTIGECVTSIGDYAFGYCSGLTSVTIPNSVTSIGNGAFRNCSSLTSMTIPNSVTSIGGYAFYGCNGLASVTIPSSVTEIGIEAFSGCSGLEKVIIPDIAAWCNISFGRYVYGPDAYGPVSNALSCSHRIYSDENTEIKNLIIPNSVTSIGSGAFYGCSGLTSVTIGNSVTEIGYEAFDGCSGLTSVTIPQSVTLIGGYAFSGCSGLTSVGIPNSVTSIGGYAFHGCNGLASVTIPNSVTEISYNAFSYCSGLASVTIPNSVTKIGSWAFLDCSSLTSVTIPNSVTSIGSSAFDKCSNLEQITVESTNPNYDSRENSNAIIRTENNTLITGCKNTRIPNSVTSIGGYAFSGCSGLTSVTIPESVTSIGDDAFYGCSGLSSVTIPNSVTSIGNYAFSGCSGLTSVTIPESVTSIGSCAFDGCSDLTSVISLNQEPNDISKFSFSYYDRNWEIYDNATLYVPEGTADKYRAKEGWKEFKNIVDGIPSSVTLPNSNASDPTETERYDINGKRIATPQRGINVVKMSDGTVKKVLVK